MPYANTEAMNLHLIEISKTVAPGAHAIVIIDGAGWHVAHDLAVPGNISLLPLPPYSPELNAQENIWQFLRQNYLAGRVFENYDAIVNACCEAWNKLVAETGRIIARHATGYRGRLHRAVGITQGAREAHAEMLDPPYLFARKSNDAFHRDLRDTYANAIKSAQTLPSLEKTLDDIPALKGMPPTVSAQVRAYAHRYKDAFAALEQEGGAASVKNALAALNDKSMSLDKAEEAIRTGVQKEMVRLATDPALEMDQKVARFDKFYDTMPKDAAWQRRNLRLEVDAHIVQETSARAKAVLDEWTTAGSITDVQSVDAAAANKPYVGQRGKYIPPYPDGSPVWDFTTTKESTFIRVHVEEPQTRGRFLLLSEDEFNRIGGADGIRRYLRLKDTPAFITDVHVPAGTRMRLGVIGPQPKLGLHSSSGVQFQLLDYIPDTSFVNTRPIK